MKDKMSDWEHLGERRAKAIVSISQTLDQLNSDEGRALKKIHRGWTITPHKSDTESPRIKARCPRCGLKWSVVSRAVAKMISERMCGYCAQQGHDSLITNNERRRVLKELRRQVISGEIDADDWGEWEEGE